MRVSKEKAARNREHILTAAARLFRENGISATGIDSIGEDAGFTHGAIYSQFGSKEMIAAEAVGLALQRSKHLWERIAEKRGRKKALAAIVAQYLSPAHRDGAGQGCVVSALGSEIARLPASVRDVFTAHLKESLEFMTEVMREDNPASRQEDAIAAFASMIGGLMLARAVNDATLSDQILKTTAARVLRSSKRTKVTHRAAPKTATKESLSCK